jgi:GT2 family glycosyltransferase
MEHARQPETSIVVCSIDAPKFERVCANYRALFAGRAIEIIGVHDARSLAEGYNRGIARSRGRQLILSHDDIEILSADFAARLDRHLRDFDLVGIAGTTRLVAGKWADAGDPYVYMLVTSPDPEKGGYATMMLGGGSLVIPGIQALDGVFMAMRRDVATAVPFDADTFDAFHLYDLDFSFRAHQAGFRLAVCRDLVLIHDSTGNYDAVWHEHKRRFEAKHREALATVRSPRSGACAWFTAATRDEVRRRCDVARLAEVAARIARSDDGSAA